MDFWFSGDEQLSAGLCWCLVDLGQVLHLH